MKLSDDPFWFSLLMNVRGIDIGTVNYLYAWGTMANDRLITELLVFKVKVLIITYRQMGLSLCRLFLARSCKEDGSLDNTVLYEGSLMEQWRQARYFRYSTSPELLTWVGGGELSLRELDSCPSPGEL